jgi:nitroreductase
MRPAADSRWLETIPKRRSRRRFDARRVDADILDAIGSVCEDFRPFPDVRAALVRDPSVDIFTGLVGPIGSYGKVRDAPHLLAFVGPEGADVQVGYVGEVLVLEATRLGLGTCWVAGSFEQETAERLVETDGKTRVHAVSPLGYAVEQKRGAERTLGRMLGSHARKPLAELTSQDPSEWPAWARAAADAARLAPSGANRQPWRFRFERGALVLFVDHGRTYWTRGYDLGCALLHAELAAKDAGDVEMQLLGPAEPGADVAAISIS